MKGYVRRKVTYNIGRTGGAGNSGSTSGGRVNHSLDHNPFYWFTERPPVESSAYEIVDETGLYPVDKEYKETGESEGWLIFEGYRRNENGKLVYRYRFQ